MSKFDLSQRRACQIFDQPRSTHRDKHKSGEFDELVRTRVIEIASEYGRYGYKRVTHMINREGFNINHKRVYRIWTQEGLKVPSKQPKSSSQ